MKNFWLKLKKPFYALAPMAGITDAACRDLAEEFGADLCYSEMASVAALCYAPSKTLALLADGQRHKPYVVQLFGGRVEQFARATALLSDVAAVKKLGFKKYRLPDGLDINLGCPVSKVLKQDAGAGLFKDLTRARAVLEAVLANTNLPVSVKIRARVGSISALDFLNKISDLKISAVMIHGRTLAQGFSGPVDAGLIKEFKAGFGGLVMANGGVTDYQSAKDLLATSGADGLGLARGVLGRPWLFQEIKESRSIKLTDKQLFALMLKHARLVSKYGGNFREFRKHLAWYTKGFKGASALRSKLILVENLAEVKAILKNAKKISS